MVVIQAFIRLGKRLVRLAWLKVVGLGIGLLSVIMNLWWIHRPRTVGLEMWIIWGVILRKNLVWRVRCHPIRILRVKLMPWILLRHIRDHMTIVWKTLWFFPEVWYTTLLMLRKRIFLEFWLRAIFSKLRWLQILIYSPNLQIFLLLRGIHNCMQNLSKK